VKISEVKVIHLRPRWSFVRVSTDEGVVGWGEANLEGRSRTVAMAIEELLPELLGKDPRQIERLWQGMYRHAFYRGGPILMSAISGIEQALWDIVGKWLGVPVSQLLGGAVRERVRVYRHIGGETEEELVASAKEAARLGFTAVKTSISGPARVLESPAYIDGQIERLSVIRQALGPSIDLAIDFHGRVGPALAVTLARAIESAQIRPLFIEEPCLPENVDALAQVARSTSIPIASGERLFAKWGFREVLEKRAVAVVQPDLAHCGGIFEGKKIAAMAETYFVGFAPHNPLGPINLAASLNLVATVPNFLAQEQVHCGQGYLTEPFSIVDGYIAVPEGPGLGFTIDEDHLQELSYDGAWQTPIWEHPDDGSVADW
jgi:galactonate dehydratase